MQSLFPCYILHQRPYRETSLLLDAFSSEHGRVGLVARGVKRRGGRPALLQPARRLNIAWSMRSELGTLTAVEASTPPARLAGTRLVSCFYMNELLVRTLHGHEAHPELFHRYEQALKGLDGGEPEDRVLRIFEKHLLKSLGYGLILTAVNRVCMAIFLWVVDSDRVLAGGSSKRAPMAAIQSGAPESSVPGT